MVGQGVLDLLEHLVGDVVVGEDVLHVVAVLERVDEPEDLARGLLVELDRDAGHEAGVGGVVVDAGVLQGGAHRDQVGRLAHDLEAVALVAHLLGPGVQHGHEHGVLVDGVRPRHHDDALGGEQVGDRTGVGHRPAVAGHRRADLHGRPVLVVGQALDEDGDPAGRVALVGDGLVVHAAGLGARPALDRAVDVVVGHRRLLRLLDGVEQRRVAGGVTAARAGRDLDVLDELGEELAALGVDRGLLVLRRRPLGVAAHERSLTVFTNISCTRASPVTSGWNDVASSAPCRTATILPAAGPSSTWPSTSTPSPTSSTHGARMKTARTGSPSTPATCRSSSKESTCRPKALRRTVMSMPPKVCWSARPSSTRSASRIIPAHAPYAGSPDRRASTNGSRSPKVRESLSMVVDSPPGITMPCSPSSSSGRRTGRAVAPASARATRCSRTSPWSARTPITGSEVTTDKPTASRVASPHGPRARAPGRAAHRAAAAPPVAGG